MPAVPSSRRLEPGTRRVVGLGVAGVAGVASVLAVAPHAQAAQPTVVVPASAPLGVAPSVTPQATAVGAIAPNYGVQKVRVGVQIKSGAYVPARTTTVGTKLDLMVDPGEGGTPVPYSCTTQPDTNTATGDSASASYCTTIDGLELNRLVPDVVRPSLTQQESAEIPRDQEQFLLPGETLTVTQASVNADLVTDPSVATVAPCEATTTPLPIPFPVCDATGNGTVVTFDDNGLPPTAAPDAATTAASQPVTIDVFANDDTAVGAPVTGQSISTPPAHGTATFTGGTQSGLASTGATPAVTPPASTAKVVYTPAAGFSGVDTFSYSFSTANGTATALVTVTVTAPSAPSSGTAPVVSTSAPVLAQTGSDDVRLALLGGALLLTGGAALAFGRRRSQQAE